MTVAAMEPWLDCYPCREAAGVLRSGFGQGFFIPFHLSWAPSFADNLRSAKELPWVLRDKIAKEVELGRIAGPYASPPFSNLRVSPLGVVPKKELGKYRLIHHLSYPKGESVNDGISKEEASVSYVSFDRAVCLVRRAGRGALLAKSDIESAFRLLPVHPDCFHLLGCCLDGHYYYDMCLPMGCSISCHYFELFSSFLEWVVRYETGSTAVTHYLDDFLFVGPADSQHCSFLLDTFRFFMARFWGPVVGRENGGAGYDPLVSWYRIGYGGYGFPLSPGEAYASAGSDRGFLCGEEGHPPSDAVHSWPAGFCLPGDAHGQGVLSTGFAGYERCSVPRSPDPAYQAAQGGSGGLAGIFAAIQRAHLLPE